MNIHEKTASLQKLIQEPFPRVGTFYEILEACGAVKTNYMEFMTTHPVECDTELLRLPEADYELCCVLITMLLREDYFSNGSFNRRLRSGQVGQVIERMIELLVLMPEENIKSFSEKALGSLGEFYVYALIDPRNDAVFYIGKGTGNRVFSHEIESGNSPTTEKVKLLKIQEIEEEGFAVKRIIVNWGLSESEAFASEAALINLIKFFPNSKLTNEVSGHHTREALLVEDFERIYGSIPLRREDIKHNILVIKINKLYRRGMSDAELYDSVRGYWKASLRTIRSKKIEYVFGVYNGLIVAVYKPDRWYYIHEKVMAPRYDMLTDEDFDRLKNRIYFVCEDYKDLDEEGKFYLYKSIAELKGIQSAQNPITYLLPEKEQ